MWVNKSTKQRSMSGLLIFLFLVQLSQNASAVTTNEVFDSNQLTSAEWVNWRPSSIISCEAVSQVAQKLGASANSRKDIPLLVHDWICKNICYDWDAFASGDYYELAPDEVLLGGKGICESIANLAQALLVEMEIPCIKVWGAAIEADASWEQTDIPPDRVNHTWNEFYMDGRWITVDCTMDMSNSYSQGEYTYLPWSRGYYDPDEHFFARTHHRLRRGNTFSEDTPSDWAKKEICTLVDAAAIPLALLSNYHAPITEADMLLLAGMTGGSDAPICRGEAAVILASHFNLNCPDSTTYKDLDSCDAAAQNAIESLNQAKIMLGTGKNTFSPNAYLTRQEALIIKARLLKEGLSCI